MSLPFFIARRIYRDEIGEKRASRPAIFIATIGIAIGLAVMIIAVSIITGFKSEIRDRLAGFDSHLRIFNLKAESAYESIPIMADDSLIAMIEGYKNVKHVQRYSIKPGMVKTSQAFQGIILKGIGPEYDTSFLNRHLLEGEIPQFSDSTSSNKVLISQSIADKLEIKLGDKLDSYYLEDDIRVRRLTVCGIYQTNFAEYDDLFMLTDVHTVNRLNGWNAMMFSGLEVQLKDYECLDEMTWQLASDLGGMSDSLGSEYCVRNIEQLNSQVFAWLGILDVNIWVILVLMIGVSGFTIVSGLLIIIIERTNMIGLLKALGAQDRVVRHLFLWFAVFLIAKGMLWGNMIGIVFYVLQKYTGLFQLNPQTYYMDTVPVSLNLWLFILLNVGTFIISVLILLAPSFLIAQIRPATSLRYE